MSHSDFRGVPQARESSMSMLRDPSMAVLGLQQRLSSTYLTSNGEDPNQDQVEIIFLLVITASITAWLMLLWADGFVCRSQIVGRFVSSP